jgi:flagellar protein FliS
MSTATSDKAKTYLRTKVHTASPAELRLMLLDGAIRFAEQGREGLARRDFEMSYNGLSRAQAILMELINALRPEESPDLCGRLQGLYLFMYRRLIEANTKRNVKPVEEVLRLLRYERETWIRLMAKLREETGTQGAGAAAGDGTPAVSVTG